MSIAMATMYQETTAVSSTTLPPSVHSIPASTSSYTEVERRHGGTDEGHVGTQREEHHKKKWWKDVFEKTRTKEEKIDKERREKRKQEIKSILETEKEARRQRERALKAARTIPTQVTIHERYRLDEQGERGAEKKHFGSIFKPKAKKEEVVEIAPIVPPLVVAQIRETKMARKFPGEAEAEHLEHGVEEIAPLQEKERKKESTGTFGRRMSTAKKEELEIPREHEMGIERETKGKQREGPTVSDYVLGDEDMGASVATERGDEKPTKLGGPSSAPSATTITEPNEDVTFPSSASSPAVLHEYEREKDVEEEEDEEESK